MRQRQTGSGVTAQAVAGTHVVLLGLDLESARRPGCLGFAIQREDRTEDERTWLRGMKTFRSTEPDLGPGATVASRQHPFQAFQWADYSAKPDHDYTYRVLPLYGRPEGLVEGDGVEVAVRTEPEGGAEHGVWFNRGGVASQEYARRFQNRAPSEIEGQSAYRWLSRGLHEALLAFLARARDSTYALHGAVYELEWPSVLAAIGTARDAGAEVCVLYDAIPSDRGPVGDNEAAIAAAGLQDVCRGRTRGRIMHNKFFVLSRHGAPLAVWTGSTNVTENGIFGHSNVGHVVERADVAQAYRAYWEQLSGDPPTSALKDWCRDANPAPVAAWDAPVRAVFSPRRGLALLDHYAGIAAGAGQPGPLFMTFAFGMHRKFQEVYERDDGVLRFALLEKEGNGSGLAQGRIDIQRIRRRPNVVVAIGHSVDANRFDRWLQERAKLSNEVNVKYVHTKTMLVDPLGAHPRLVTGSANFSEASTETNDENMLLIQDDARVADIYLGEFMRVYAHHAFRESLKRAIERGEDLERWHPSYLDEDDRWQRDALTPGHQRFLRRRYFAGG